ncbi:tRNA-splicing endonuclease subunit Sen2-2, partial [Nymphaea thermarum]
SESCASLSNEVVLCEAEPEQAELLNRACFGRPVTTVTKGRQWFQLGLEEAFYLSNALNCPTVVGEDGSPKDPQNLGKCMKDSISLLVLSISGVNSSNEFPACLDEWTIEEYTIGRWEAQQYREDEIPLKVENKCRTSSCDSNAFPDQIKQKE